MTNNTAYLAEVDENGNLILPEEVRERYGLCPGTMVRMEMGENEVSILHPRKDLARVYIEPTNRCNLEGRTCIRNVWEEPLGVMTWDIYERILDGIRAFTPMPTLFLGGFGEPLVHPRIIEMVRQAKQRGVWVELITNGILLSAAVFAQFN